MTTHTNTQNDTPAATPLPTIHLNGTSRDSLLDGYINAMRVLRLAIDALQAAAPHSRDYYTQAGDTFCTAQNHHFTRLARLRETLDELQTIAEHVSSAL
jgi:hypothetical protein